MPEKISKITQGQIIFNGKELQNASESEYRKIRGKDIGMIFQEPMTALNPVLKLRIK